MVIFYYCVYSSAEVFFPFQSKTNILILPYTPYISFKMITS